MLKDTAEFVSLVLFAATIIVWSVILTGSGTP